MTTPSKAKSLAAKLAEANYKVVSKDLLDNLVPAIVESFGASEEDAKTFVESFTSSRFAKRKGQTTGFLLFSKENRESAKAKLKKANNVDPSLGDVGKELGRLWSALGAQGKKPWNEKAKKLNEDSAGTTPVTPAPVSAKTSKPKKAPAKPKGKSQTKKAAQEEDETLDSLSE